MATPLNRLGGMVLDCQMATRTLCKPHAIGSSPAFSSSAGLSHMPAALPPISLEIASLTLVRLGGSSLTGVSSTGIAILLEGQPDTVARQSPTFITPTWCEMACPFTEWTSHLWGGGGAVFSGPGRQYEGHFLGNGLPQQDSWTVPYPFSAESMPCIPRIAQITIAIKTCHATYICGLQSLQQDEILPCP